MKATFKTITIKPHEQMMRECVEIMDAAIRGEQVKPEEPQYSFTSFEAFRKAMTPQRFALLKVIREKQPESIKELAAITGRDMKNISEDVKILLEMDLIEMEKHGKNKAPRLHYEGFRLEVAV
jgi:predicted transcriptional regulator